MTNNARSRKYVFAAGASSALILLLVVGYFTFRSEEGPTLAVTPRVSASDQKTKPPGVSKTVVMPTPPPDASTPAVLPVNPGFSKLTGPYGLAQIGEASMIIPRNAWKNVGKGTMLDAVQSIYAATQSGDVDYLEKAIVLDKGAKIVLQPYWDSLTAEQKTQHVSQERLVAEFMASAPPIKGYSPGMLGKVDADGVHFYVNVLTEKHAGRISGAPLTFRENASGEWTQVITPQMASRWVRALTDNTFASGPFVELKSPGK